MTEHVYKVVELVGSSEESVTKAIDRAISKAASLSGILAGFRSCRSVDMLKTARWRSIR